LVVLLAGLLGRGRARGRVGIVRMLLTVGIMLAPFLSPEGWHDRQVFPSSAWPSIKARF